MTSKYSHVFNPIEIRGVYFKNRIELAPPGCGNGADSNGLPTPAFLDYFRPYAKGGSAIVTVGNCSIDLSECHDESSAQLELRYDECIPGLAAFADMCKTYGAHGSIEVNHNGATQGNKDDNKAGYNGFAPSPVVTSAEIVRAKRDGRAPLATREMSVQKIEETIQKFAESALRCKKAGMETLIFHGAHGNLLAQFFSPFFNRRTDAYGGSIANRSRFAIEMLDATRALVGEDFVIEYRISADEFVDGHSRFPETMEFIKLIKDKVDILHVSGGLHDVQGEPWHMRPMVQPYNWDWMYNVHFAADVKKTFPDLIVNTVGSIKNIAQAEEIIASGKADFVAMKRALQADPDMPRKYAEGREWSHRPCLRCSCRFSTFPDVFGRECAVNPYIGHFGRFPDGAVNPAPTSKKVAVIGGGPAGITAMQTLVERGHEVTLYEKNALVGGCIEQAAMLPEKRDVGQYLDYLRAQIKHTAASVKLGVEATAEMISAEGYDAVIAAVGAEPVIPNLPGVDKSFVNWAPDAPDYTSDDSVKNIVVVGAGATGLEFAVHYNGLGKNVTVVEMKSMPTIPASASGVLGGEYDLLEGLADEKIAKFFNNKLTRIKDGAVVVEDVLTGESSEIAADAVLLSVGMKPRFELAQSFRACTPNTAVYVVGDALKLGEIRGATRTAFEAALNV